MKEFCRISHYENRGSQYSINVDWVLSFMKNYQKFNAICDTQESDTLLLNDLVWKPTLNLNLRLDVDAGVDFNRNILSDGISGARRVVSFVVQRHVVLEIKDRLKERSLSSFVVGWTSVRSLVLSMLLFSHIQWKQSRRCNFLMILGQKVPWPQRFDL